MVNAKAAAETAARGGDPYREQKTTGCYAKYTRGWRFRSTENRRYDAERCTHITDNILLNFADM